MKNENEKKGLFERLFESKKTKKNTCCCNIELEELPEQNTDNKKPNDPPKQKNNSCCN